MISLQQKVFDYLLSGIESGRLKPYEKLPAESELCGLFKASRNTVRKAYDELVHKDYVVRKPGLGSFVSERPREGKILNIGVVVPGMDVFDEYSDPVAGSLKYDIFNGALDRAHEINAKVNLVLSESEILPEIDGYLLLYYSDALIKKLKDAGTSCLSIHLGTPLRGIPSVYCDLKASFKECFRYLISRGHRKIGIVDTAQEKFSALPAFREIINEYGLSAGPSCVKKFKNGLGHDGRNAFEKLIKDNKELDAVFFRTDRAAIDALEFCVQNNIRVPEDISIMAYDNIPESAETFPKLTTFDTMRRKRGYMGMKELENVIVNSEKAVSLNKVHGKIIERESVKYKTGG